VSHTIKMKTKNKKLDTLELLKKKIDTYDKLLNFFYIILQIMLHIGFIALFYFIMKHNNVTQTYFYLLPPYLAIICSIFVWGAFQDNIQEEFFND